MMFQVPEIRNSITLPTTAPAQPRLLKLSKDKKDVIVVRYNFCGWSRIIIVGFKIIIDKDYSSA